MKKKLAIIGSHLGQTMLVKKAMEMGIETHCFAWDRGDNPLCKNIVDKYHPISTQDKEKILEVCRKIKIDGVLTRLEENIPTVSFIAQEMNLPGNKYEDALIMANKYRQRQTFSKHGVRSPRFALAGNNPDLSDFKYPLIVKPADRTGSIGVLKVEKEENLAKAIERAYELSYSKEVLIEEYITGIEVSVNPISWTGKHYRMAIRDKENSGPPYFVETEYHEPTQMSKDLQDKVLTEAQKALTALNFNYGASNTDMKITETGEVYVIEFNARLGGDITHEIVRLSTGYDIQKGVIDLALNQFKEPVITEEKHAGIYFLSKETEWVKQVIENKENDPDIVITRIYSDELRNIQSSSDRSGYFIYQSEQKRRWGSVNKLN